MNKQGKDKLKMIENAISSLNTTIFDFALLKKKYGEETAFEVTDLFLKDLSETLEKIESTYTTNDWSALEKLVHKFRG